MSFTTIYRTIFMRNSVFVATVFAGTFVFQGFFNAGVDKFWANHNKGKLWADIKSKYVEGGDEEEDDE